MKSVVLFVFFICFAYAKPIIDFRDSNIPGFYEKPFYERSEFIIATQGKHSHLIVLSEGELFHVNHYRRQGYTKIVALLMEPRVVHGSIYDFINKNIGKFDLVLTFDRHLLEKYPTKCRFIHATVPNFVKDIGVHPKSRLCSIVIGRTDETADRMLRKKALDLYKPYFDAYKSDSTPRTRWKDPWLKDFCFSVAIENCREPHYFTEKLLDCFRSGTIPIYWGTPTIGEFFDMDGIIIFHSLEELGDILRNLSFEEYNRRLPAVLHNFELSEKYPSFEFSPDGPSMMDSIWNSLRGEL